MPNSTRNADSSREDGKAVGKGIDNGKVVRPEHLIDIGHVTGQGIDRPQIQGSPVDTMTRTHADCA